MLLAKPLEMLLEMQPVEQPVKLPVVLLDLPFVELFVVLPLRLHNSYLHMQYKPIVTKLALLHLILLVV